MSAMPLNPYESSQIVVAELVDRPRPAKKRHPLLAAVFFICDFPFLAFTVWMVYRASLSTQEGRYPTNQELIALACFSPLLISPWLIFALCAKEWIQAFRGR